MSLQIPKELESEIDELIGRYPLKRSAALMVMHALQDHFGYLSSESLAWIAFKLQIQPIQLLELATFYPMFHDKPLGNFHFKICRTLSCAINGSHKLHRFLCEQLGLDPENPNPQTTKDGLFTVEFVECLAACNKAPAIMINDKLVEMATESELRVLIEKLKKDKND